MTKNFTLKVKNDHLSKISKATSVNALSELIWNSLDADADQVEVFFKEYDGHVAEVVIKDNGTGIDYSKIENLFGSLGGSWKANSEKTTTQGRFLHGKEGQGRLKSFSIGRVVVWEVIYQKDNDFYEYKIESHADQPKSFNVSEEIISNKKCTGVTVTISELDKKSGSLKAEDLNKLVSIFALYLIKYPSVIIYLGGEKIVLESFVKDEKTLQLANVEYSDRTHPVELRILEWHNKIKNKELLLSNDKGFTLERCHEKFKVSNDFSFSAFLTSSLFDKLHSENLLTAGTFTPVLSSVVNNALAELNTHFFNRTVEDCQFELEKWKEEKIYPYEKDSINPIEDAERKVFDIVAVNIKRSLPSFDKSDKKSKKFQLRMLKQAIEKNPEDLQTIIEEVLQLSECQQNEFAELLKDTSLTSIISASTLVADRLKFIAGLEIMLFDSESKKIFKERSQLHKILAENTWIFGDEFSLSVNDKSLTEVLKKHFRLINKDAIIDSPVTLINGRSGIVDLMLSKSIPCNHKEDVEHLIVELKAPKVNIGEAEISQIKKYAFAIAKDERFRNLNTRWTFLIISNDIDDYVKEELKQYEHKHERGVLYTRDGFVILVKTWSEIIRENRHRLEFIRNQLNFSVDSGDALKHLREKYAKFTSGITTTMD